MEKYILWNGDIIDPEEKDGLISFDDRGYQFGDGVYEVIRIYKGAMHLLDLHLDRLFRSMKELNITPPLTREQFIDELGRLIGHNQFDQDGNLYVQVTRGLQPRAHIYNPGSKAVYYAKIDHFQKPVEILQNGVSVTVQEDIRWLRCDIKSLNLLPNIMAMTNAYHNGFYEPLFVRDGIVRECGASNFFLVKDGKVITHPANHFILNGITRLHVLRLAKELNLPVEEREIDRNELYTADECFLTATPLEVVPITHIDEHQVNGGEAGRITRKLQKRYEQSISNDLYTF
ncbi:D-amino-acid transaminase [Halobacillus andaensis]|uniref:D-amino-acid transaminase n=1 Tax=Halobacillus andaensis TaxID=1176239 RepID=UPI003D743892